MPQCLDAVPGNLRPCPTTITSEPPSASRHGVALVAMGAVPAHATRTSALLHAYLDIDFPSCIRHPIITYCDNSAHVQMHTSQLCALFVLSDKHICLPYVAYTSADGPVLLPYPSFGKLKISFIRSDIRYVFAKCSYSC